MEPMQLLLLFHLVFVYTGTINVSSNASLKLVNNTLPTLGTLASASTVDYAGTTQTIVAANYGNLTNSSNGTRTLASSGTIGVAGIYTPTTGTRTITGSTINFNGTGSQTIPASNYNNLTISGSRSSATITLASGVISIAGTLGITATGSPAYVLTGNTVDFSSSSAQSIPAFNYNNVTNTGNGARTFANSGIIGIAGTYTPTTASRTITGSTINFNGSSAQTIPAIIYNNLTLTNSAGASITGNVIVNSILTFTSGKITTGINTLIANGTVTGGGTGWVIGNLQKPVTTGTSTKTFEIGGNGNYRPVVVNLNGVTTAGTLTATVSQTDNTGFPAASAFTGSGLDANKLLKRYYTLTPSTTFGGTYDATFNFANADISPNSTDASNYIVRRYTGSAFAAPVSSSVPATLSVKGTGFAAYGDYLIGDPSPEPTLVATALPSFGNACINTDGGPNDFTISGSNLTTDDVLVTAPSNFTISTSSGGSYSSSLSIPQTGGSLSQVIFVKFRPTAVSAYSSNIVLGGGGTTTSYNVAASGSGVNTAPSVSTGSASNIASTSATLPGTITATGCSAVASYGIEYSTTNGFVNGTGTEVPTNNLASGTFSVSLSNLSTSTTFYFKAFATNSGGIAYGTQASFTTLTPTLTLGTLTTFSSVCINTTVGPNSFTVSGSNLNTADVTIAALNGYTYSLSSGGTYTSTLVFPKQVEPCLHKCLCKILSHSSSVLQWEYCCWWRRSSKWQCRSLG